jgi:hypothetical protein
MDSLKSGCGPVPNIWNSHRVNSSKRRSSIAQVTTAERPRFRLCWKYAHYYVQVIRIVTSLRHLNLFYSSLKSQWELGLLISPTLIIKSNALCSQSIFTNFIWFSVQRANCSLNIIKRFIFLIGTVCFLWGRNIMFNTFYRSFRFQRFKIIFCQRGALFDLYVGGSS